MRSPEGTPFSVATGALWLDLVYTGGAGDRSRWEALHTPSDVAAWALSSGVVSDPSTVRIDEADLRATHRLRETLWDMANRLADGKLPTSDAVAHLNTVAQEADPVPQLVLRSGALELDRGRNADGAQVLSAIARDAIALLSGPHADRVKRCAATDCALLFVDTSRPGARRWCAMSRCGNRDKARTRRRFEKG